ncbi:MAG: choice-of-anchor tandem repeat GloVer-containing protein [Candidatus Sulfotelmatobacter sp.]
MARSCGLPAVRNLQIRQQNCTGTIRAKVAACAIVLLFALPLPAQTFTVLASFGDEFGNNPGGPLVQGLDGNFYGVTPYGPEFGVGTIFRATPTGTLTTIYQFCLQTGCPDGYQPYGALVQTLDGSFYGTTALGGAYNGGTVYKITPSGYLTTIYSFCALPACADGDGPVSGLVQAADGNFYGTTEGGGTYASGAVFKITPQGALTVLHSFDSYSEGVEPTSLMQSSNGTFYGSTIFGGTSYTDTGTGTLFSISPEGDYTFLYTWPCGTRVCLDGTNPSGGLAEAPNGNLYGATEEGGPDNYGVLFELTPSGNVRPVYGFSAAEGEGPDDEGPLLFATDGNIYGTTVEGGAHGFGTIFQFTLQGQLTTLYNFCTLPNCADGAYGAAGVIQGTNGVFYGTTVRGGPNNSEYGVFYSLSMGLGPFIETQQPSARSGARVAILGNHLNGTTSVSFNGAAAAFNVVSSTEIVATVPAGATTGFVSATTPGGVLTSNREFTVLH